jgi:4-amino-4-deoxy-L-arabinose transferase-like glycosyltransferase
MKRTARRVWTVVVRTLRAVPRAAWVCAAIAIINAFCWALILPPFQVPDEPSHFAYVKQLAETGTLPTSHEKEFAREENLVLDELRESPFMPPTGTISSRAEHQRFEAALGEAAEEAREGSPAAGVATSQPPFYYALEAIPYLVGYDGNLLTRLELMRLFSALFAGITAMFVFLFVREALPATRIAPTAAGLSIAFAPLLGFMSGSVNPDSLLFAMSALLFWSLAFTFRRGLNYQRAVLIGVITALGLLTKLNFAGMLPGAIVGLAVLATRAPYSLRRPAYRPFAIGAGIAVVPAVIYVFINLVTNKPTLGAVTTATRLVHGSLFPAIEATWRLFLPHLPGMKAYAGGSVFATREIWFNGFVGQYGWVETAFPAWVYTIALWIGIALVVGCVWTLVTLRRTVLRRAAELAVYAVVAIGLVLLIGFAAFFGGGHEQSYTQARYLLPLLALFAAGLALAARAGGKRWEAVLGTSIVLALFADDIFSQLLVIARFYG